MAWFTCTPVSFKGSTDFFCRDSGLICKGIQSLGIPCKSVMPLPGYAEDIKEDIIRTKPENLSNPDWWKGVGAEKVVLYSWGHPKYWKVAEALKKSGAKIFINLDNAGILPTTISLGQLLKIIISKQIRTYGALFGIPYGISRSLLTWIYTPIMREPRRIAHLRSANAIGCISPAALSLWRLWARKYAHELVERLHLVPNPVADYIKYDNKVKKQDSVIAVGRWNFVECKRPALLANVIEMVAKVRGNTVFHIYGNPGKILNTWYSELSKDIRRRVYLHGKVSHQELVDMYMKSRVGLCTSSHEASHVSSEEALCAGASIAAPLRIELNCMLWYVSYNSGRLSIEDTAKGLAETLLLELEAWDRGERNPEVISNYWHSQLSVNAVIKKILSLLE
jgi:hypothetical protein